MKKGLLFFSAAIVLVLVIFFFFRERFLQYYVHKISSSFSQDHGGQVCIEKASFIDLNTIVLDRVSVIPPSGDTLFKAGSLVLCVRLPWLIAGKIRVSEMDVSDVYFSPMRIDSTDNFSFLRKSNKARQTNKTEHEGYAGSLNEFINYFFDRIPEKIHLNDVSISYFNGKQLLTMDIDSSTIAKEHFSVRMSVYSGRKKKDWIMEGAIGKKDHTLDVSIYSGDKSSLLIPYLPERWNTYAGFDTVAFRMDEVRFSDGKLYLRGSAGITSLFVNHPRLAPRDVSVQRFNVNYSAVIGDEEITLDSTSEVTLNAMHIKPFIRYRYKPSHEVVVNADMAPISGDDFFSSLPQGMFSTLEGAEAEGSLDYHLRFAVDLDHADSAYFSSDLHKEKFRVRKTGNGNFTLINQPFEYTAYEKGVPVKVFMVGPENPDYTPIGNISELLKNCVLTSEDGAFFYHHGFNEEMFAKSIAQNIREKRFARGGSTISMQLVKNLFLSRNKTIGRKLEEALIVWMIESNHLVSKERMLEVYLNIIEWGPGIYGIGEASRFYFAKKPSDLDLAESIFLASIVPSPKYFKYSFDEYGNLKGKLEGYYKLVAGILHRKEVITDEEFAQLQPRVELKGPAKRMVLPPGTVPPEEVIEY